MKNQDATGFQHPSKLGDILMAAGRRDVLKHEARINEAEIIVLQALQLGAFVQLKIAVGTITIERLRRADHGGRDIDATTFRKIFGHRACQSTYAATEVEGGRHFIDAKANSGSVPKYCFNLFAARGKKLFLPPLSVAFAGIGAYCPQWICLGQPLPVSLQFFK